MHATDLKRIKKALEGPSNGPKFFTDSSITQVPEDTFLFATAKEPDFFAIRVWRQRYFYIECSIWILYL